MSRKWSPAEIKTLMRHHEAGLSQTEIAERMGRTHGSVHGVFKRIRDRSDALSLEGKTLDERGNAKIIEAAQRPNDPAYACLAHWRDLDRHHPRGWPSLRIPPDYRSKIRTYHAEHNSITGSSAAMCAGY